MDYSLNQLLPAAKELGGTFMCRLEIGIVNNQSGGFADPVQPT